MSAIFNFPEFTNNLYTYHKKWMVIIKMKQNGAMPKSYSQKTTRTGSLAEWVPLKKILKLLGKIDDSSRLNIIQLTNDYLTIKFYQAIYGLRSFKEIRNLI